MKFIIAKKIGMTQHYSDTGAAIPVTVLQAGPITVTQVKTTSTDGYDGVQVGFGTRKASRISQAVTGHLKGTGPFAVLKEFRLSPDDTAQYSHGQVLTAEIFSAGDKVKATGTSIGRGFAGVVKRHGFAGSPATHGHKDQLRRSGSVGAQEPQRVFPGTRMAGRMGGSQASVRNLEVVHVDTVTGQVMVRGAVPGAAGSIVCLQSMS